MVERRSPKPNAEGSSPSWPGFYFKLDEFEDFTLKI